jgi:hypothetical protein
MYRQLKIILLLMIAALSSNGQNLTQTIRGTVIDKDAKIPIPGANILVLESNPVKGTATDANGYFNLENIPVGRVSLRISALGYETTFTKNLVIESAKETVLEITLIESVESLNEITVTAKKTNGKAINKMALISAKTFTVEETGRYAGALNDPARMVSAFAGVGSDASGNNDIVVRGNSPRGVLWRLEGIEVPNPNHFAGEGTTGGPVSTLNASMLSNSDFFTGAFAPEYGNALSGVFDVKFRNGNNHKREYSASVGILGTDITLEGPFKKDYNGSYLVNYRYSTLDLMSELGMVDFGGIPRYQDISFKINLPTKNMGKFTLIGLGGQSAIYGEDTEGLDEDEDPYESFDVKAGLGVLALKHNYILNERSYLESFVATTGSFSGEDVKQDPGTPQEALSQDARFYRNRIRIGTKFNEKINSKNTINTGFVYSQMFYRMRYREDLNTNNPITYLDIKDNTGALQGHFTWKHRFNKNLTFVSGVHYMHLMLNNKFSIEPRFALDYRLGGGWVFNYGAGLHSKLEPVSIYMTKDEDDPSQMPNKNLEITKAVHNVMGIKHYFTEHLMAKVEVYYQYLYDVPVENDMESTFSALNQTSSFAAPNLINKGTGENYGVELTLERFFHNNFYYMLTGSLYKSTYTALDNKKRNTQFDANYASNLLLGKEFVLDKNRKSRYLGVNLKATLLGGNRYSPIDLEASIASGETEILTEQTYEKKYDDVFFINLGLSYRFNRPKTTHEIKMEVRNLTNNQAVTARYYDDSREEIMEVNQLQLLPNFSYTIKF